jgi:PAS domain-containing protein
MNESQDPLFDDVDSYALLTSLLDVSLSGVILFRPVYNTNGFITDLAYVHLNPAAQRMLNLPQHPTETFLTLYPHTQQTGIFAFYRDTYLSGEVGYYEVNYSHDGLDNYFHLSARASGSLLVVSFTDTADQNRSQVEMDLRVSQQRERETFFQVFEQAPAIIALLRGPQHFFQYCNPAFQALFSNRALAGHFFAEVMPEIVAAGLVAELDRVYTTGITFYGNELSLITTAHDGSAP